MKKLFYLTMMLTSMLWSCDKDDLDGNNPNGKEGVITMVAETDEIRELWIESFKEGETITIDWGDETEEKFKTVVDYDEDGGYYTDFCRHSYSNSNPHKITIKGDIKGLGCSWNKNLTSLDVSKCTALTYLGCNDNDLTSLDVSGCKALTELYCHNNNLSSLDVSGCKALTDLNCYNNNLSSLDVSGCTALTELDCRNNNLSSLDVSKCTALTELDCYDNNLTSLDVSGCKALTELYCHNNDLTSLDVSGCKALTKLYCHNNNLSASILNRIFNDLPMGSKYYISFNNNPGSNTCDVSIAQKKGWKFYSY